MAEIAVEQEVPFYHAVNRTEAIKVGALGAAVGVIIPLVGVLIHQLVITPVFCQDPNASGVCDANNLVGYYVAAALITAVAAAVLIGWGVFRALLIAVGSILTLWGLQKYVDPLATSSSIEYYLVSGVMFLLCYLLFYWMMRLRNFGLGLGLAVVVVMLVRWALLV